MSTNDRKKALWLRDLERFLPLKSQFVLTGNIRDLQILDIGGVVAAVPLQQVLTASLAQAGYDDVLIFDPIVGIKPQDRADGTNVDVDKLFHRLGLTASNGVAPISQEELGSAIQKVVSAAGAPLTLIVDYASRLMVRNDALSLVEHELFTRSLVLSHSVQSRPVGPKRSPLFNLVVWIADKEGDLPDWFTIGNPRIRHIPVSKPNWQQRKALANSLVRSLPGGRASTPDTLSEAETSLADSTDGLLLTDLNAIAQLARSENVVVTHIGDAVRRYKVGVTEDPWRTIDFKRIQSGAEFVTRRVMGQDRAVTHMLDIVKRAATGIGGARSGGRPRGVAFLAGPTGVGKTELAKTITELLFGDEGAYIRFDMSEFNADHAEQRLLGAPPGYVGYDVGGELTNAIREKPFSVVLFDEIEKAHPRILDKFLQILDDGVLTSGRGDRVYFSEALIVFTSNLGIYKTDAQGNRSAHVSPELPYAEVQTKIRAEIDSHFKLVLNRPEILNRIGENIIVFDFIRPEIAERIYHAMLNRILSDAALSGFRLSISNHAQQTLQDLCVSDLSNGGRGIRNKLEVHLINPLARALFGRTGDGTFVIEKIVVGDTTTIELAT